MFVLFCDKIDFNEETTSNVNTIRILFIVFFTPMFCRQASHFQITKMYSLHVALKRSEALMLCCFANQKTFQEGTLWWFVRKFRIVSTCLLWSAHFLQRITNFCFSFAFTLFAGFENFTAHPRCSWDLMACGDSLVASSTRMLSMVWIENWMKRSGWIESEPRHLCSDLTLRWSPDFNPGTTWPRVTTTGHGPIPWGGGDHQNWFFISSSRNFLKKVSLKLRGTVWKPRTGVPRFALIFTQICGMKIYKILS